MNSIFRATEKILSAAARIVAPRKRFFALRKRFLVFCSVIIRGFGHVPPEGGNGCASGAQPYEKP